MAKQKFAPVKGPKVTWKNAFKRDWQLYLLLLVPLVLVFVFSYAAYPGMRMVFMNYKPAKGYAGSEWVGLDIFKKIFKDADFLRALRNSLVFNFLDLLVGTPIPILLALLLTSSAILSLKSFPRRSYICPISSHGRSSAVLLTSSLNPAAA